MGQSAKITLNPSRCMSLLSILSRRPEKWQIDPALFASLLADIALIKAKPVRVVEVRKQKPK